MDDFFSSARETVDDITEEHMTRYEEEEARIAANPTISPEAIDERTEANNAKKELHIE